MMLILYVFMSLVIAAFYFGKRTFGAALLLTTIGLCWLLLWYHATTPLQINW